LQVVQEGNTLKISNIEYYHESLMPASRFQEYETVLNAAAVLNKLKIVLTKGT
jgi:hypothetical protein